MGYWKAVQHNALGYNSGLEARVGANSVAFLPWDFLSNTTEFVTLSGAGDTIVGVSASQVTLASDNQTVARTKILYTPSFVDFTSYDVPILGGTITTADINKYYDITSTQVVDGATESTTTGQLQLVDLILAPSGATMGLGRFKIANL